MSFHERTRNENVSPGEKSQLRAKQREVIFSQLDPRLQKVSNRLFPTDRLVLSAGDYDKQLVNLIDHEEVPGGGYRFLLNMVCTAQSPEELANIFSALSRLSSIGEGHRNYGPPAATKIRASQDAYMAGHVPPEDIAVSREAKSIAADIPREKRYKFTFLDYFETSKYKMEEVSRSFRNLKSEFALETYMYMLIKDESEHFRRDLLRFVYLFPFGRNFIFMPFFAKDASFWNQVDGSWAGIIVEQGQRNSKDEILSERSTDIAGDATMRESSGTTADREMYLDLLRRHEDLEIAYTGLALDKDRWKQLARRADQDNEKLRQEMTLLRRELRSIQSSEGTASHPVDKFLVGNGYSRDALYRLPSDERPRVVRNLRRIAGIAFHQDAGNDVRKSDTLKEINAFLDSIK